MAADGVLDSVTTSVFEAHELIKKTRNNNNSPGLPETFITAKRNHKSRGLNLSLRFRVGTLEMACPRAVKGADGLGESRLHQGDFFLKIWSQFVPLGDGGVALLAALGDAAPMGLAAAATV